LFALGLGVGGLGGYALAEREPLDATTQAVETTRTPPAELAAAPERDAAPSPQPEEPSGQAPTRSRPATLDAGRRAKAVAHEPHEPRAAGADEVALMQRVHRALSRGEASWALALLRQLDAEVPGGRLLEERAAGSAIARCMLEPQSGAEVLARYTTLYPSSVHSTRVSLACGEPIPPPPATPRR
jgi:hypothetical protein